MTSQPGQERQAGKPESGIAMRNTLLAYLKSLPAKSSDYTWSLGDQAVVSAANFLTLVLLARYSSASELGLYVIGLSILTICLTVQDSLVIRPYATQFFRTSSTAAEHAFSALALSSLLSGAIALACVAASTAVFAFGGHDALSQLLLILAMAVPLGLFREFMRRFGFANMRILRSFLMDLTSSVLCLATLSLLALGGTLSAFRAIMVIAVIQGLTSICWFWTYRDAFHVRYRAIAGNLAMSWSLGKWLLPGKIAMESQGYMTHWVASAVSGTALTGVYSASLSIIGLANPFLHGIFNVVLPKSVRVLHHHGYSGLRRQIMGETALIAAVTGVFVLFIHFAGDWLLVLLFPGDEYSGNGPILTILSLSYFAAAVGGPPTIALTSAERGREVAGLAILTCVASLVSVYFLLSSYGLIGAAAGMLAIEITGSILRWMMMIVLLSDGRERSVRRAQTTSILDKQVAKT